MLESKIAGVVSFEIGAPSQREPWRRLSLLDAWRGAKFEERHPIGSKARLALALFQFTGRRKSDVVLFGKQHVRDGRVIFTQQKNRHRKPARLELPVLPALRKIIDASPCCDLTFPVTEFGKPFGVKGFGGKMRQWCDETRPGAETRETRETPYPPSR